MIRSLRRDDELFSPALAVVRWQVIDPRLRKGTFKAFDCVSLCEKYVSFEEINSAIISGELVLKRAGEPLHSAAEQNDPALDARLTAAKRALRDIAQLQRKLGVSFSSAYKITIDSLSEEERAKFPALSTVYRYEATHRQELPILRGNKNKGNRKPRFSDKVVELICDLANSHFLKPQSPWTLDDLAAYVNRLAREYGYLPSNCFVGRSFIAKTIYENESVDPEESRMHPSVVRAAKSIAKKRIRVFWPFERVEQDAVHLPFVISTPYGPSSNVWLIHAIDCSTGAVVGWHLFIGSPNVSESLRCVEKILFPKRKFFEAMGINMPFDLFGTPSLMVFDNGPEVRAGRMQQLVRLGTSVMHCRAHEANGKPFVERLNRSLKEALQLLPGTTRMDNKDGARDPLEMGDKLMNLEELERWIVRWYYEVWGRNELKRHLRTDFEDRVRNGHSPNERWQRMTEELGFATQFSPSLKEWRMTLYKHERRTLNRKTGVTYDTFNYKGENIDYLLKKYGNTEVTVLADPDDYRRVFVVDGENGPLVELVEEYVSETTPAMTFDEAKATVPVKRKSTDPVAAKYQADVQAVSVANVGFQTRKRKAKSRVEQNREVTQKTRAEHAVARAAANPLGTTSRPVGDAGSTESMAAPPSLYEDVQALPVVDRKTGEGRP